MANGRPKPLIKWGVRLGTPLVLAACAAGGYWYYTVNAASGQTVSVASFQTVAVKDLEIVLKLNGDLQAVESTDIASTVEGSTTIVEIVKEGTFVHKGDVLIVLDSADIRQRIEDTTLDLQKAENDVVTARELREIQLSKNAADLEAADVAVRLAQLDLRQYLEGTYPQSLADAKTTLEMARITLKNREEELAQSRSLFAKGFVTATEIKKSELELTNARNAVAKAETALVVLTQYTHEMNLASKKNALAQAEQRLIRTRRENASNLSQRDAELRAKEQALELIKRRMERLQRQLAGCTIKAPDDGMVVYATSGDRNAQNLIQEGATVRERQALLRLPDTSRMKVVVRLNESQVPKVRENLRATVNVVGVPRPLSGRVSRISVLADSGSRWWNPDSKEFPVDITLDSTPPGLKPGMGAQVEILVDRVEQAVTVPLGAVYSAGRDTYVFLPQGGEMVPRKIQLGRANDTHAQVVSGLQPGETVKLLEAGEGRALLERAGINPEPTTRGFGAGGEGRPRRGGGAGGTNAGGMPGTGGGGAGTGAGAAGNGSGTPRGGTGVAGNGADAPRNSAGAPAGGIAPGVGTPARDPGATGRGNMDGNPGQGPR